MWVWCVIFVDGRVRFAFAPTLAALAALTATSGVVVDVARLGEGLGTRDAPR